MLADLYIIQLGIPLNRSIFQLWQPNLKVNSLNVKNIKNMNLNFGPQHPAAHGVLRLILQLDGEIVEKLDPHVGLLHRGSEKLIENKQYLQSLPYFDRFDYVSMLCQEHSYCLAIESLSNTSNYTSTFVKIRTIYDELTRVLNHMLGIACHALDVGSMSSIFWSFEEREKIMEFYERVSGARMHAAFYRPNEINNNSLSLYLLEDILEFTRNCFTTLNEMHNVLTYNKIWKQRLVNIGSYSYKTVIDHGLSGVLARCVGIKRDIRLSKLETYGNYYYLNFRSFIGTNGDSYDRFLIRMNEMCESLFIINQCIFNLKRNKAHTINGDERRWGIGYSYTELKECVNTDLILKGSKLRNPEFSELWHNRLLNYLNLTYWSKKTKSNNYSNMEELINHFKYWGDTLKVTENITYKCIESPKGEFGVLLVSDNTKKPYKCKVRSPAFQSMQFYPQVSKGHFLADLVTLIGTIDIVFGEIDR